MGKYIRLTRTYLVLATVFVVFRFVLELAGVNEYVTSEISLTRLLLVLPVFWEFASLGSPLGAGRRWCWPIWSTWSGESVW